jgi:hypothetical protein
VACIIEQRKCINEQESGPKAPGGSKTDRVFIVESEGRAKTSGESAKETGRQGVY